MVHQIWLGDRRDDPTAANYSAEDLVLVQRDIGRLAQYTEDMGASIELLNLSLRIPPWEPMHTLTADERAARPSRQRTGAVRSRGVGLCDGAGSGAGPRSRPRRPPMACAPVRSASAAGRWSTVPAAPCWRASIRLTVEGDEIGSFDLVVSCGGPMATIIRSTTPSGATTATSRRQRPRSAAVTLVVGGKSVPLKSCRRSATQTARTQHLRGADGAGQVDRHASRSRQSFDHDRHRNGGHPRRRSASAIPARSRICRCWPRAAPRRSAIARICRCGRPPAAQEYFIPRLGRPWPLCLRSGRSPTTTASNVSMVEAWRAL